MKKIISCLIFLFLVFSTSHCKSESCNGFKGFINELPVLTELTDCKKDNTLFNLALLAALQSSNSSPSSCPGRLSPVDMSGANLISCSETALKEAITIGGKIQLPPSCTITLTSQIVALKDFQLDGNGGTISGNNAHRIFSLGSIANFSTTGLNVTIQNITLRDGRSSFLTDTNANVSAGDGSAIFTTLNNNTQIINVKFIDNVAVSTSEGGGAIRSRGQGKLIVSGSLFQNNEANAGGAINSLLTDLTVIDSTFINNRAKPNSGGGGGSGAEAGSGGAIYTDGAGSDGTSSTSSNGNLVVCGSYFEKNHGIKGGAYFSYIYGNISTSTITNSLFVENTAGTTVVSGQGLGGAVYHGGGADESRTNLFIENSTFIKNISSNHGGGIATFPKASISVKNSSFIENEAQGNGGVGGGMFISQAKLENVTVAKNIAKGFGGGLAPSSTNNYNIINSIIAYNKANNPYGNAQNCQKLGVGQNSIEFPQVKNSSDPNDPNCYSGIKIADPMLDSNFTDCSQRVGHDGSYRIKVLNKQSGSAQSLGAICK